MDLSGGASEQFQTEQESLGGDLAAHLPGLLDAAGVTHVLLATFTKKPSFHGHSSTTQAENISSAARAEHLERHFGFWEYALREAVDADAKTRRYLLNGALRHDAGDEALTPLKLVDFVATMRAGGFEDLPQRTIVTLTSAVHERGVAEQVHLPMLDLGVRIGPSGQLAALDALRALHLKGLLFESGRSYHFYGAQPLPETELRSLLGRAQLLSPIVDARWIAHQLIDGRCGLRISTDRERHLERHRFVARVN